LIWLSTPALFLLFPGFSFPDFQVPATFVQHFASIFYFAAVAVAGLAFVGPDTRAKE
jgi:hypothetical protein